MNYYAAVDKDGSKVLFGAKPKRVDSMWRGWVEMPPSMLEEYKGFPNITWDDEPKLVRLTIEVIDEE